MKKIFLVTVMVAAAFALGVTGARADTYQFMPTTQVESYKDSEAVIWNGGYWHYVISNTGVTYFNIKGADLSGGTLKIYTGWPGAQAIDLGAIAADLTLYSAGNVWMVRLYGGDELGTLFLNPATYYTSVDKFESTGYTYGGAYDQLAAKPVPVWATSGQVFDNGNPVIVTVTWGTDEVDVELSDIPGFDIGNFSFLYASATCANSVLTGHVPLPASALLLGSGLIGLVGLGWRRRSKS